jgi:predicted O-methyltransferase YrrM
MLIDHVPSKRLRHAARMRLRYAKRPRRYRQLLAIAAERAPSRIVEVGVHRGVRAVEVVEAASLGRGASAITYHGFDLFEGLTDELLTSELSKKPDPLGTVRERIERTGAKVTLHAGFSQDTIPAFAAANPGFRADLIFVDGGHAVETIRTDLSNCVPLLAEGGVIVMDDYYVDCPHKTDRFGCNVVLEELGAEEWSWRRLPIVDVFTKHEDAHNVAMAEVRRA